MEEEQKESTCQLNGQSNSGIHPELNCWPERNELENFSTKTIS